MKTVIKFSAGFCQPCKQLNPIFYDVVTDMSNIRVVDVDVEVCPDIASSYKIRAVPTIVITNEKDEVLAMKTGMMTKEQLIQFINES